MEALAGMTYTGKLTGKSTSDYKTKNGGTGTNHTLIMESDGYKREIRTNLEAYKALTEGETYIIPVMIRDFPYIDKKTKAPTSGHNVIMRKKDCNVYTQDGELVEIKY